jgi:hypothetical protein
MGFSQNLGWEMGIGSPLQGPLSDVENRETFARIEKMNISATMFLSLPKNLAKNKLVPLLYELYVYLHNYSRSCLIPLIIPNELM